MLIKYPFYFIMEASSDEEIHAFEVMQPSKKKSKTADGSTPKTAKKPPLTLQQKVDQKAEKDQTRLANIQAALQHDWKKVDQTKVCFMPPPLVYPQPEFAQLIPSLIRDGARKPQHEILMDIFLKIFDADMLDAMTSEIPIEAMTFSRVRDNHWHIDRKKQLEGLAIYFRICAMQDGPVPIAPGENGIVESITKARRHFASLDLPPGSEQEPVLCIDYAKRIITHMLIRPQHYKLLSDRFQSLLHCLGRYVSGDEKLWFYSGASSCVRLVPSKPDQIGLWMYELCCQLQNGCVFLLYFRMHDNRSKKAIPTLEICGQWADVILNVGKSNVAPGVKPNPGTLIAFDSYYCNKAVVGHFVSNEIPFTSSFKSANFKDLVATVLPVGYNDRHAKEGDTHSIYNETLNQVVTHHFDTQKGVGQKFNMSYGFVTSTKPSDIAKHVTQPPCYEYYKWMFGDCDTFNTSIKRAKWPHKRGGRNIPGMEGCHNDFVMASAFQNMHHVYLNAANLTKDDCNMQDFLFALADAVFVYVKTRNI
jgi:hypothetical protein